MLSVNWLFEVLVFQSCCLTSSGSLCVTVESSSLMQYSFYMYFYFTLFHFVFHLFYFLLFYLISFISFYFIYSTFHFIFNLFPVDHSLLC